LPVGFVPTLPGTGVLPTIRQAGKSDDAGVLLGRLANFFVARVAGISHCSMHCFSSSN
jgi:hypothetical protein